MLIFKPNLRLLHVRYLAWKPQEGEKNPHERKLTQNEMSENQIVYTHKRTHAHKHTHTHTTKEKQLFPSVAVSVPTFMCSHSLKLEQHVK